MAERRTSTRWLNSPAFWRVYMFLLGAATAVQMRWKLELPRPLANVAITGIIAVNAYTLGRLHGSGHG